MGFSKLLCPSRIILLGLQVQHLMHSGESFTTLNTSPKVSQSRTLQPLPSSPPSLSSLKARSSASSTTANPTPSTTAYRDRASTVVLSAVLSSKTVIYDGSEWKSIQQCLKEEDKISSPKLYGFMDVVVGTTGIENNQRVVGILCSDDEVNAGKDRAKNTIALNGDKNEILYGDSVAKVPKSISDQEAIETMIASLSSIHCALPVLKNIGGDEQQRDGLVFGKVVVLGGNDYALFAAKGLAALGTTVSLVTTGSPKIDIANVDLLAPEEDDQGFCAYIGKFDCLLDTIEDERGTARDNIWNNDDISSNENSVLKLLRTRHNCKNYVSTVNIAQSIVCDEGLLFGPGQADKHVQSLQDALKSKPSSFQQIVPPIDFGRNVETLFGKGIFYNGKGNKEKKNIIVRSWNLGAFWEQASWPSDTSCDTRYGLPVIESVDEVYEGIAEQLSPRESDAYATGEDRTFNNEENRISVGSRQSSFDNDPFVKNIVGVEGFLEEIVNEKANCVLFLSGSYCVTCKTLSPKYSRMARTEFKSTDKSNVFFAKADTTGKIGKFLGKYLEVESVPTFMLFKNGKKYGRSMSISKFPSKELNAALELLENEIGIL